MPTALGDHRVLNTSNERFSEEVEPANLNIMADISLTPLARALSQPQLDGIAGTCDVGPPRNAPLQPSRRRLLSSCASVEAVERMTSAQEARVLVINTGGTIGMTLHDDGS